ncbi:zinc-ribbon domain-containing protein [Halostella litorea]|uniref:zinc-ribbon domain-containing protein n=1 Tax=Halostella litorea TaxID=2528831 RepID=UPI001092DC15|nr:zinc-ribbon domain-containing protein [Halostella litorea]
MGFIDTVRDVLAASNASPARGGAGDESAGAYWCHDCDERIRDVDAPGDGTPDCPACGDAMEFERSAASTGCAC